MEEPSDVKLSSQLLLLWYWTPPGGSPANQSCQIYPHYQCNQYVGRGKYDFVFKRFYQENDNRSTVGVLHRRVDLVINEVGIEDEGCYNCRPWIDSSPLPVEESSDVFCLQSALHYEHLPSCTEDDIEDYITSSSATIIKTTSTQSTTAIKPPSITQTQSMPIIKLSSSPSIITTNIIGLNNDYVTPSTQAKLR